MREYIWQVMHDADRHVRYYGGLQKRYEWWGRLTRGSILFLSLAVISDAKKFIEYSEIGFSFLLGLAVTLDFVMGFDKKATAAGIASSRCDFLLHNLRSLWIEVYPKPKDFYDEHIQEKLDTISVELSVTHQGISSVGILSSRRLNAKHQEASNKAVPSYFRNGEKATA